MLQKVLFNYTIKPMKTYILIALSLLMIEYCMPVETTASHLVEILSPKPTLVTLQLIDKTTKKSLQGKVYFVDEQLYTQTNSYGIIRRYVSTGKDSIAIKVYSVGYASKTMYIHLESSVQEIEMEQFASKTNDIIVLANTSTLGAGSLEGIQETAIYEGKKTEVIVPALLQANKATSQARQIFSRVPGLHIWESDKAGLNVSIGGRGLSPNRSAHFNTRMNGLDLSAVNLGYPES